jgi:hypothetical protein
VAISSRDQEGQAGIAFYVSIGGRDAMPFQFDGDVVTVGRSETVDLRIDRPMLSRHQFTVERDRDGRYYLVPEPTTNPTRLNGSPLRNASQLADGDLIAVGDVQIHVGIEGDPGEAAGEGDDGHYDALDQMRGRSRSGIEKGYGPDEDGTPRQSEPPPPPTAKARTARPTATSQTPKGPAKSKRPLILGVGAVLFCGGVLAWASMGGGDDDDDLGAERAQLDVEIIRPQPAQQCEPAECLERAKRTYEVATNLEARAETDLGDLYRAAVAYEKTAVLLKAAGAGADVLPSLARRKKLARDRVEQELREMKFRFSRARRDKDKKKSIAELDNMLRLIADEDHPYRKRVQASRRRIVSGQ